MTVRYLPSGNRSGQIKPAHGRHELRQPLVVGVEHIVQGNALAAARQTARAPQPDCPAETQTEDTLLYPMAEKLNKT
jgi:hypothetical protein